MKISVICMKCIAILKRLCHKSKEPLHRRLLVHDLLLSPIQTSNSLIIQVSEETKSWLWWGSVLKGWRVGAVMWSLTLSCSEKGTTEWGPHEMTVSWQTEGQLKSPMAHRPFISAISEGLPTLQRGSSPTLLVLPLVCCFFFFAQYDYHKFISKGQKEMAQAFIRTIPKPAKSFPIY